jgi:uncharacterized FlaG/YvyC family protein
MSFFKVNSIEQRLSAVYAPKPERPVEEAPFSAEASGAAQKTTRDEEHRKTSNPIPVTKPMGDVYLKFDVNADTHEVVVFVIDRANESVVRTIPADELRQMQSGELVKLLA